MKCLRATLEYKWSWYRGILRDRCADCRRPYVLLQMFFRFFIRRATSELPRPIAVKLCHMIAIWVFFIMWVQKLGGPSPKEIEGPKRAKFGVISDNFRLWSRISPEWVKISKIGKTCDDQRFLPRSTKKNCGELCSTNYRPTENCMWVWTHQNCIFRETIFRPLGGASPSNFNTHYRLTKAW